MAGKASISAASSLENTVSSLSDWLPGAGLLYSEVFRGFLVPLFGRKL
jgi:hypothetical protein